MLKKVLLILVLAAAGAPAFAQSASLWTLTEDRLIPSIGQRQIIPLVYRTYQLDVATLQPLLAQAPRRFGPGAGAGILLSLPMPDGNLAEFRIWETPVMHPDLQARYPAIRCYTGQGITDPTATLKADLTPRGFHAMVLSARTGSWFIDPFQTGDRTTVITYFKKDFHTKKSFSCEMDEALAGLAPDSSPENEDALLMPGDCQLRVYRLALACTGEYAQFHGGTVPLVMAAFNTSMNRVNGIAETDAAITMELVPNNDTLIYLNASTDPYTNNNGGTMLGQNQTACNQRIGTANYDIGHVFSTGGGGIAGDIGVVCKASNKAQGVTGSNQPIGDPFDVDYVIHEMGHQFAGTHTYNSCGGNGNGSGVEAGSGTSIMAYAGICNGNENVLPNSEAFFHGINLPQIAAYMVTGTGNSCPVRIVTGNNAPTVEAGENYTIPKSTPFALTAVGTDPDAADALTYGWEQMDAQTVSASPQPTNTTGPMFRAFAPVESPIRTFPRTQELLSNASYAWEKLPSVARTMKFRVTVRDNFPGAGCTGQDNMTVTVSGSSGPFQVTAPNTNVTWLGSETKTVTWSVAGSDLAPVNCTEVRILLSIDGGYTFPLVLAENVPNSGSADVTVPLVLSTTCRVKVEAVGNIFFDLSNQNFRIDPPPTPTFTLSAVAPGPQICTGEQLAFPVQTNSVLNFAEPIQFVLTGLPAGAVAEVTPNPALPGDLVQVTIDNLLPAATGSYTLVLTGTAGVEVKTVQFTTTLIAPLSGGPTLLNSPSDGSAEVSLNPTLTWQTVAGATSYQLQVATNPAFTPGSIVRQITIGVNSQALTGLDPATVYFWRVRAFNFCDAGAFSEVHIFRTGNSNCDNASTATNVPIAISGSGIGTSISTLTVPTNQTISDVNVSVQIDHSWIGDLDVRLRSPQDVEIVLFDRPGFPLDGNGCAEDDVAVILDDEAVQTADELEASCNPAPPSIAGTFQPLDALSAFDGDNAQGQWQLRVTDNADIDGGNIVAWSLTFCFGDGSTLPVGQLLTNTPLTVVQSGAGSITPDYLLFDQSGASAEVVYQITTAPGHGQLTGPDGPLGLGDTFTQADLENSTVVYTHNGDNATSDSFVFSVVDQDNLAWLPNQLFQINVLQNTLAATLTVTQPLTCSGGFDGKIAVAATGGTAPLQYSLNGGSPQASPTFDGLPAGAYTVVVSDSNGFTLTLNPVQLDAPAALTLTPDVIGNNLTLNASGGTGALEYSLDGQNFSGNPVFAGLADGVYTATVRDQNGCTASTLAVIAVNGLVAGASVQQAVACPETQSGSIVVTAGGGQGPYTYSLDGQNFSASNVFSSLGAGTYTVTVQDALGAQTTTAPVTLTGPTPLSVSATVAGNVLTAMATGGSGPLQYSLDGQTFQYTTTFGGLANGLYTVTVRDANGCTVVSSAVEIAVIPLAISATQTGTILCNGDSTGQLTVVATGGTAPFQYRIGFGPYQDSNVFDNLPAGTYTVKVKDALGQTASETITIAQPDALDAAATVVGRKITVTATGGTGALLYALDNGQPQASPVFTDVANGEHEITITDANGCSATVTATVDYQPLSATVSDFMLDCYGDNDGQILVQPTGGVAPYEYSLDGGAFQTSPLFTGLVAGTYTITVRDAEGETITDNNVQVLEPAPVVATATATMQTVTVTASGGTGSFLYSLNGQVFQSGPTFNNVPLGTYTVTVRDANNCTATTTVVVNTIHTVEPGAAWGLTVMPNPGPGLFRIAVALPPAHGLRLDVSDAAGRRLHSLEIAGTNGTLDLNSYPAGVYFLRVFDGERVGTMRLVVSR